MKWKKEVPNKAEYVKINSFNFIENEKYNNELEHPENVKKIQQESESYCKETKESNLQSRTEIMIETLPSLMNKRTDFQGITPKRYTTKCYFTPATVPCWYNESLLLKLNSTKKIYSEKVYFKSKLKPYHWSENMTTEVKTYPKCIYSELDIPIEDDGFHYISLVSQQVIDENNTTEL